MFILLHKLLFFARVILQYTLLYNLTDFLIVGSGAMPKAKYVIIIPEVWGGPFMEHTEETVVNLSNGPQVIYKHLFTFTIDAFT